MAEKKEPLLLLDNSTMYVIGAGDYHSTNLTFEEAKAIIDMYQTCLLYTSPSPRD